MGFTEPGRAGTPYRAVGKKAQAEKILRDWQGKLEGTSVSSYTMATIYAGLGDDKALEFLENAHPTLALELSSRNADLGIDSLRSGSRFQNWLRRVGLTNWRSSSGIALTRARGAALMARARQFASMFVGCCRRLPRRKQILAHPC